jgi:DNA-binding LacI/PurR family transcriptional regulator
LEDVASRAGVSRALVSIVMREVPGASAETRQRVMAAAGEIGYRPDARARLLASGQSRLLGAVFGMAGRFHSELLDGLYVAAEALDYQVILSGLTASRDEARAAETLLEFRCEAVILLAQERPMPVLAGRLPVVAVGWQVEEPSVDVVRTSDADGMRRAVEHLVDLGHRRILHIDGGSGPVSTARRRSFRAAVRKTGLKDHARVIRGGVSQENGFFAARDLLATETLPTAIIAYNDDVAAGLIEALIGGGVAVPEQVSVIGWDDSSLARLPHLNLTTVRQDAEEMTRLAVERSIARIHADSIENREQVLSPELIIRGSTAAPSS